ncbi:hypothetical protein [Rhodococcus triatomae]|nr:hypothetical protein G419_20745 [Rhodococcus triatomae BKS 15-14]
MYALATGHGLYPTRDGTWHYLTTTETAVRIGAPSDLVAEVDAHLGDPRIRLTEGATQLAEALVARGVLTPVSGPDLESSRAHRVVVEGSGIVAALIVRDLRAACPRGTVVDTVDARTVTEEIVAATDVLVSVAPALPDAHWSTLDRWCRLHGTAWHRATVEGGAVSLGPFSTSDGASYTDLRHRRLAASAVADDLEDWWKHLDTKPAAPWNPRPDCAAHVAALLVADILAWMSGETPRNSRRQLRIDPVTANVTAHPVLPLPLEVATP